ncbi:MAG: response regulator [Bacteroidales bacterium]|nr:response regulator [Bacteroidales bacterium]
MKVLIIENDFVSRHYLRDLLRYSGHTCQTAMNASEGLDIYANGRPDAIICNVMLPGISGLEFLRDIRKKDSTTAIVMISTESSERLAVQVFRSGADDFLKKPIQDKDILPMLDKFASRMPKRQDDMEPYGEVESGKLKFIFPTEYDGTSNIMPRIMEKLSDDYFSIDDRVSIELGLSELVTNAIEHGNLNITYDEKTAVADTADAMMDLCNTRLLNPEIASRLITVYYEFSPEECKWTIIDEGNGFDVSKVPDPTKQEQRETLFHGRGIMFSRAIFDSVEYKGKGNEVVVTKKRNFLV